MSEASHPSHDGEHRRKRRKLTPDEKLLQARIEAASKEQAPLIDTPSIPSELPVRQHSRRPMPAAPAVAGLLSQPVVKGCLRVLKMATRTTVVIYLIVLAIVLVAIDRMGQSNLTTAALMYLPPWPWIAPAFFLLLPALFFDWKAAPALLLAIALFLQVYLDLQWRTAPLSSPPTPFETLRALTWNRGQSKHASLQPLKNELKPDFILLQDAAGRGKGYKGDKNYAEFRAVAEAGEFVLLSRWPILSSEVLSTRSDADNLPPGNLGAARFVVLAAGTRVTLYSVHLPSPRDALESYKRGSFLWGILGIPGTPWEAKKLRYQVFWDEQIARAAEILRRIQSEEGPVLVMGDFNTPAMGPIYRMYAETTLQDAHRSTGGGLGFTFPGDTGNPLALFQPWLRLDQIFASPHWQILQCAPQPARAQHLPVFGEFKLAKEPSL
ncbi:MAG: endonuclease/exonuclease/phosphatase family protein [Prosthecobacter sp.]|nr:endonuclease/exonuclease/phosphatase family protein [Prosthecobacter sp.]